MYYFSPADKVLLFVDAHGKTRLELPKKLKTDRKTQGGLDDGARLYEDEGVTPPEHDLEATELPAIDLWASREVGYYHPSAHTGTVVDALSGASAGICSPDWDWMLFYSGPQSAWKRMVKLHGGRRHEVFPHAAGVVVTSCAPRDERAYAIFLDAQGASTGTFEEKGIAPPVFHLGRIAWQRDEDTIVVRSLGGDEIVFSVDAVTKTAHGAKKHPRVVGKGGNWLGDLDNKGRGRIFLGEEKVLFLPAHGETILDLTAGEEIHRKLPEAEFNVRRAYARKVERATALGKSADVFVNGHRLEIKKGRYPGFFYGIEQTLGDGGLVGVMVTGAIAALFGEDETDRVVDLWRYSGMNGGGHDYMSGESNEEELLRAIGILDEHAVHLAWTLWPLRSVYERRLSSWGSNHHDEKMGRVLPKEVEKILMLAFLESTEDTPRYGEVKSRSSFRLLDRVEGYRAAKVDRAWFEERAAEVKHSNIDEGFFADLAKSYFDDGPWRSEDD